MLLSKSWKAERHIEFTSVTSQKDSLHSWQQPKEKPTILAYPELQNKTKFSKEWSLWYEGLNHREADWIQAPHTSSVYANFPPILIPPFLLNALEISFVQCLCWPPPSWGAFNMLYQKPCTAKQQLDCLQNNFRTPLDWIAH